MEDQGQKNGRMVNVEVSDGIDRSELFGGLDKNLRLIEENLKVDIIQRDDSLILKGEYASVSYTHLDVYKRQTQGNAIITIIKGVIDI